MRISRRKGLLIAGIALIALSLLLITSSPFQQWLLRRAESYAANAGFPFTARRLRLDFTDLQASLDGITYDRNGQRIQVERLLVDLPWNALRGEDVRITAVEADGVVVNIQAPETSANPPAQSINTTTATAGTKPRRIRVDRLAIRNVSLTYSTPKATVNIPSLSLEATDGRGTIRMDAPASIGTEANVVLREIPFVVDNESVKFGPTAWKVRYAKYGGSGSAQGVVRWSPAVAFDAEVSTDPLTIEKWKDIGFSAKASYANGAFDISELRATQGSGEIEGSARISETGTSTKLTWKDVILDPSGFVGRTDGALNLNWTRSDFGDLAGDGHVNLNSRQYGVLQTELRIAEARAAIDLRANASDLAIRGQVAAGLEPLLAGNLNGLRGTVRGNIQPLPASPLYRRVDTVNVSAAAMFRDNTLTIRDVYAKSKGSAVSGAALQANLTNRRIRGSIPEVLVDVSDFATNAVGTVRLSADITGSFDEPVASFTGSSSGIDVGSTHIDNLALNGDYSDGLHGGFSGTLHPFAPGTSFPGLSAIDVSARARLKGDLVTVENVNARSKASLVSDASLELNLTDKQIRGNVPTVRIDLSDFAMETQGVVNLAGDIGGTIDQPTGLFAGSSTGLDIGGTHIDTVGLEGKFENKTLSLTQLEARQADGILTANGSVNLATEMVTAEAEVVDLKIVQVANLYTTASLKAKADGTYRSPHIDFSGQLRDVIYQEQQLGTVELDGSTDLKTASLRAKSEKYTATVVGDVTLQQPYPFTAALTSAKSNIRYDKYEVVADGQVRISGEALPFKANTLEFDAFKLRGEGIDLSANGPTSTGVALSIDVDLADLPIEQIELKGKAHASATVRGNLNDPSIEGTLTTENATVRFTPTIDPADISAEVNFTGRDFTIRTLQATYAGATATITGNGSWQGAGQLQFRVANVRPENLLPGRHLSGIAAAEGQLDIKSPKLEDVSGIVKVTELNMMVRDVAVHQIQPIEVELDNQILTVRSFEIEGLQTHASIKGNANLRDGSLNLDADADTDLTILEPFIPNSHPSGRMETRVAIRGTSEKPSLNGFVNISGGELAIETPDLVLSDVNVQAQLRDDRIELSRADGMLNGGTFEASGGTAIAATGLRDTAFKVNVVRGQLQYPEGLQSEFSSQLALEGSMPNLTLRGNVEVLNAIYQKDLKLAQTLFARITAPPPPLSTAASEGLSSQIRMEVEVRAENSVVVKNNVADLEATGTFQIRGTVANPVILGRASVLEGGELYFGPAVSNQAVETTQRADRYSIERGSIDFNNPLRTDPELDFVATHELEVADERYLVTLQVSGTPETLKADLTSDPHLEQSDIITMLLTGRTLQDLQGTYATVAGEQALNYLSGQLSARVLSQAGNVLGLNTVRIDPVTVANQTDVAARLTLAKDITSEFSLVYSQNMNDAKAQTWIAAYKPFKRFVVRGINDGEQNEILVDLKHELRLGGGDALLERTRPKDELRLRNVTFAGSDFLEKDLRKHVTKEGNPFGVYRVGQDVRNLRRFLASQGYPSARIQTQQSMENRFIDVKFDITQGPKIVFGYEGAEVPESLQKEIEQIWTLRSSDAASQRDSIKRLLRHFRSDGYVQAQVSVDSPPSNAPERRYVFQIVPGYKFDKPAWVFNGIEPMNLHEPAGLVMERPEAIKEQIESTLRSNGYLDVKSTVPELVIEGTKAHFEVTVDRGNAYTVKAVEFEGNHAVDAEHLREIVMTEAAKKKEEPVRFTSEWLEAARRNITGEYWKRGFNDVLIVPSTNSDSSLAQTTVRFAITEGELQIIEGIEITGARVTSRSFIDRQFEFKKGDPVDLTKINLTRKKLYDTRLFKRVETEVVRGTNGYIARIHLIENAPWQLRYGVSVTEHLDDGNRSIGLATDLSYNNFLGRAITVGISGKLNTDEKDGRIFGSAPQLFGRKVITSLTVFRTQDSSDPEDVVDYWGTTAQQQWRFRDHFLLSYDYSYRRVLRGERTTTTSVLDDDEDTVLEDIRVPLARFGIVLSHDTRDDILNATRGHFISNSFEIAPPGIGSSMEFYRNFSQYLHFQPFKKFVFASAIRFGVAKSIEDQPLDPTLQYKSGGSTTVRAFKQDELTREPGNFKFIVNQEFRFPLFWKFSGVTFVDAGQVALKSENIFNLRWGPGLGIRINTPFLLLRTDLGINVNRRPGEDRGRWSFGIGQAF